MPSFGVLMSMVCAVDAERHCSVIILCHMLYCDMISGRDICQTVLYMISI